MKKNFCNLAGVVLLSMSASAMDTFPPVSQLPRHSELPEPLVMFSGKPVASKKDWVKKRAPELKALFQHYEYGYFPPASKISAKLDHVDKNFFEGKATLKLVTIAFGPPQTPRIHLMLVVPNARQHPAPVFVGLNFAGNHTLVTDTNVPLSSGWVSAKRPGVVDNRATEASRGTQVDVWALEQSIDRGYAVATFFCGDIQADLPEARGGVRDFFHGSKNISDDWGTIAAWAWGIQRAVDYLITDKDLDQKRIAVVGHSRLGKTALVAAAFDERIALAIPLQAGCGGTSPSRGKIGESVKKINTTFPHWFCNEFKTFNDEPERLPFDQHCLIALCAPRPVLLSCATEDTWANPAGQFEMLQAADKVYRLLGVEGLSAPAMPPENKLIDSTLGYYIRPGKHAMTTGDWKIFLDFADKHFGKPNGK
jgi:dienelactone hydrolase